MQELEISDVSLADILQRQPTLYEESWGHLPAFRIGSVARIINDEYSVTLEERPITAICLFPNAEGFPSMVWAYKLGDEGNIFYPENKLSVLVPLSD